MAMRTAKLATLTTEERQALRHFQSGTHISQLTPLHPSHAQQNKPIPVYQTGIAHRLFPDIRSGFHNLALTAGGRFMGRPIRNYNFKHHQVGGNHRM